MCKSGNEGRELTYKQLCKELAKLAKKEELSFPYKDNERAFAQKMGALGSDLSKFFTITDRSIGGHKTVHTFMRKGKEDKA